MIFLPCSKTEKWDEIQKACERDEKLLQLKQQVGNAGDANSKRKRLIEWQRQIELLHIFVNP